MPVALNTYASKVYAEHPIASWPLDDDAYFLSLINNNDRLFSTWTLTNASYNDSPSIIGIDPSPFENSDIYSSLIGSSSSAITIEAKSQSIIDLANLRNQINTFCINFYLYQNPTKVNWYKIGYEYYDNILDQYQTILSDEISPPTTESWINLNKTFNFPAKNNGTVKIIIQISLKSGSTIAQRTFIMNGLSVGQWSETSCSKSLGATKTSLPSSTQLFGLEGVVAEQYGILSEYAYYIVEQNKLIAYNDSLPLIYGTDTSTVIVPSINQNPSLIFPGKGMLNALGKSNDYTLEFWMQIKPSTEIAKRIIGPLSSNNGIYVKEGYIIIVQDDEISSHSVEEWHRPMLIDITVDDKYFNLILNGEQVASIYLYNKPEFSELTGPDWWGIYSYPEIDFFKIDNISISQYAISVEAAKRRFVWGQGTPSQQFIDNSFQGNTHTIDFSNSEYDSNILYPDVAKWDVAYFNNIVATKNYIATPKYSLPEVAIGGRDIDEWYLDNLLVNNIEYPEKTHPKFFTFRPNVTIDNNGNAEWKPLLKLVDENGNPLQIPEGTNWTTASYLNFQTINFLNEPLTAFYAIFESELSLNYEQPLMYFVNTISKNTFKINLFENEVRYYLDNVLIYTQEIDIDNHFVVGINIQTFGTSVAPEILDFFSSPSSIQLYVGGNGIDTYEEKIYNVSFLNQLNYDKVSNYFNINGTPIYNSIELFAQNFATYTLIPTEEYGLFFLDLAINSQWEEYYPLSYFAKYVNDENGNKIYDLDYLQINIGYPTIQQELLWDYSALNAKFLTYEKLDSASITNYSNYYDLNNDNSTGSSLDLSKSSLKMYFSIQPANEQSIKSIEDYQLIVPIADDGTIIPVEEVFGQYSLYDILYEFKDNSIIYPLDININQHAIVFYFILNQKTIINNPFKIRNFEITSKTLNADKLNAIGTKFGRKIYPYTKENNIYKIKENNPICIYKRNTPYLYKTEKSGIKVLRNLYESKEYGILVPVNTSTASDFNIAAMQLWMLYDYIDFSKYNELPIFEINNKSKIIEFVIIPNDDLVRGTIIARNKETQEEINNIVFYQNGIQINNPIIEKYKWICLGIAFQEEIEFNGIEGSINLLGGIVYNDISYYPSAGLNKILSATFRNWEDIAGGTPPTNTWSYWTGNTWRQVYYSSATISYYLSPKDIYNTYIGTNKLVVDDDTGITINNSSLFSYTDVSWSVYIR